MGIPTPPDPLEFDPEKWYYCHLRMWNSEGEYTPSCVEIATMGYGYWWIKGDKILEHGPGCIQDSAFMSFTILEILEISDVNPY